MTITTQMLKDAGTALPYLSKQDWKKRELEIGKSCAIMREFEKVAGGYGLEALLRWQLHNGLISKPRFRVKAKSQEGNS